MRDVTVVTGEALVDLVLSPDGSLVGHRGGGPYNVARTVARLEQPVWYLGRLSTDGFGHRLRRGLEEDGVGLDAVVATDAPTTLALAEVDESGSASYVFYAEGTSSPGLTLDEARAALPEAPAALCAGTLGLVFEPMATTIETLVAEAAPETLVALDPNCRPSTIDDPAAYRGRLDRLLRRSDVLKASDDDLRWLVPDASPADAARALIGRGDGVALVTLGGRGALVVCGDEVREVPAPAVEVADTIGAGDSFMGGFLAWWRARELSRAELPDLDRLADAAAFACRVAAITCSRPGADPPHLAEL